MHHPQYYYPPGPQLYGHRHSPSYDSSMMGYPPPPPSSHSRSSSGGHVFSPSAAPYALSPMPHYSNEGLPIDTSSPAALSPLNYYASQGHGYPPHFLSTSTPLEPFRPHPPSLPAIERASGSPAPSKGSVQSTVSADKDKDGKMKRTPRKYTKKADYWVENGGLGRKGGNKKTPAGQTSSSEVENSTPGKKGKSALPTPPKSASTPMLSRGPLRSALSQETLVAKDEPAETTAGGELARLRSEEEEEEKLKEEKRPGWLKRSRREGRQGRGVEVVEGEGEGQGRKLDLWQPKTPVKGKGSTASTSEEGTATSSRPAVDSAAGSQSPRLISPLSPSRRASRPPMVLTPISSIPRTVSAPTLLMSADGRATLSSTQILSSEMAWLMPLNPRPVRSTTSISVEEDDESKQAREEKKRRRLAAFAKDGLDFFASPETERTRSLSRSQSSSNLVAAQVVGVGRVAMAKTALDAMEEAGTAQKVDSPTKEDSKDKAVARLMGRVTRPNWPENEYPWGEPEMEKAKTIDEQKKMSLSLVERYLDGSSDEEDSDDDLTRFPANPLELWRSDERTMTVPDTSSYMELSSSRRGGKSSYGLIGDGIKRTRVQSARTIASLEAKTFDPSDARQALLLKRQASSTFSMSQFRNISSNHLAARAQGRDEFYETSAVIGCVCREDLDGDDIGMVECDLCQTWHHLDCLGLDEDDLGDEWFCWKCAPGDQPDVPYADEEPLSSIASSALLRTPNLSASLPTFAPNNSPSMAISPAQSPIFGSRPPGVAGTPIQRFGTPRLVSSSSYTSMSTNANPTPHSAQSPSSSRFRPSHDFGDSIGLGTPAAGPSRSTWDSGRILSTPKFADFDPTEEAFYDLGSTPSRHLGRELPFGGTPTSRKPSGPGGVGGPYGRLSAFTTPSQTQEFFNGLQASPRIPSSSGHPSSVDSSGPYSPRWPGPHASPIVYGQNRMTSASRTSLFGEGGTGGTPRARMVSAMASGLGGGTEKKGKGEHVRFGEPLLPTMIKQQTQQRALGLGMGQQEEFGRGEFANVNLTGKEFEVGL